MPDDRVEAKPYQPPQILERSPISVPLLGFVSGVDSSAAFRPA
jgi:hypothetical protein